MATGSRTLKLSILADVDQLNKSLKAANGDVEDSSNKMMDFGKKAGLVFAAAAAAAGAYAIKIGIDGVKAAIADEASQSKLSKTLENVTGATKDQIAAVENQITKMQLANGVADDVLRPALSRLTISTGDITKAQDLLSVALDVSTATGKPLETVANALGKAYDGNSTALGKLGVGLTATELKTMSFEEQQAKLSDLFGGAAAKNAETFQGRMDRLKEAMNEAKETIGVALLPILQTLVGYFTQYVLPIVEKISGAFSDPDSGLSGSLQKVVATIKSYVTPIFEGVVSLFGDVKKAISDNIDSFKSFFEVVQYIAPLIGEIIGGALTVIGKIAGIVIDIFGKVLGAIKPIMNFAIDGINKIITGINLISPKQDIPYLTKIGESSPNTANPSTGGYVGSVFVQPTITTPTVNPTFTTPSGGTNVPSSVGSSAGAASAAAAGISQNIQVAGVSGYAQALAAMGGSNLAGGSGFGTNSGGVNVYMGVVGDPEAAARVIVDTVNNSSYRGTGGANNFVLVS